MIVSCTAAWMLAAGCSSPKTPANDTMTVSILPLKSIVSRITGGDFPMEVLVPPGASPEMYEPTPAQMIKIAGSKLIFTTGLIDFEQELVARLGDDPSVGERIVDLSRGIDLIAGGHCNHAHGGQDVHDAGGTHRHGVDPHIWSSPSGMRKMAETAYERIALLYPDSTRYALNFSDLINEIDSADRAIQAKTEASDIKFFLIYHPALSYWARDYGFEQIALENDGKEPSADHLRRIIALAREKGIKKVFYQAQFSRQTVDALAREIGGEPIEIDPLAEDAIGNIVRITNLITEN